MIRPLGNYITIEAKKVDNKTDWGFELDPDETTKEQAVEPTGKVIGIGPTAFKRWKGCESPRWLEMALKEWGKMGSPPGALEALCDYWKWEDPDYPPHKQWGIDIGDVVEHRKFNAMDSVTSGDTVYRYIPDIEILGAIDDE